MIIRTLLRIAEMTGHCRLYGRGRGNAPPLPGSVPLPLLRKNFIQRMGQNRHVNGLGDVRVHARRKGFLRSSSKALAVIATMGMFALRGSSMARILRVAV